MPVRDGERGMAQGPDLAGREPRQPQVLVRCRQDGLRAHIVPLRAQAAPDRGGARRGQLLSDHDPRRGPRSRRGRRRRAGTMPPAISRAMTGSASARASRPSADRVAGSEQGGRTHRPAVPRRASARDPPRLPVRPEPERAAAPRSCLLGPAERTPGGGVRRTASSAHRGYRSRALPSGLRGRDPRRPRLAGSRLGRRRSAASPSILTITAGRPPPCRRAGLLYPCFCSRSAIGEAVARREAGTGLAWPRDPDGAPLYPGTCRDRPLPEVESRIAAGEPHAWRIDMEAALRAVPGPCRYRCFTPAGGGRPRRRPARRAGATRSWCARTRRRAIISRSWWTMRSRASPMWCAAGISRRRPTSMSCCSDARAGDAALSPSRPRSRPHGREAREEPRLGDPGRSAGEGRCAAHDVRKHLGFVTRRPGPAARPRWSRGPGPSRESTERRGEGDALLVALGEQIGVDARRAGGEQHRDAGPGRRHLEDLAWPAPGR